jgi:hypothetical protein
MFADHVRLLMLSQIALSLLSEFMSSWTHAHIKLKGCELLGVYMPIDTTFLGAAFAAPLA